MKKHTVIMALLSAGLMSHAVNAAPSSSVLEWSGFVSGAFAGTEIGLTGQGGGDIQKGVLNINDDGAFSSARSIIVEAHAIDATDPSKPEISDEMFDGDVNWSMSALNVSHAAYDLADVVVSMNGDEMSVGSPLSTTAGNHTVGFSVSGTAATPDALTPGDAVSVTAMIFAEPKV